MKKTTEGLRPFTTRLTGEEWLFLKHTAANKKTSMQKIIRASIRLYRKMLINKLTKDDTMVL